MHVARPTRTAILEMRATPRPEREVRARTLFLMCDDLTPFEEGQFAFAAGEKLADNPYPSGTPEHRRWADGWALEKQIEEGDR